MPRLEKWLGSVPPDASLEPIARQVIRERLAAVDTLLEQVFDGSDEVESVHQLRVWTRRADAALVLFKPLLAKKPRKWMQQRLRRLRAAAGSVRDCDVHLEHLSGKTKSSRGLVKRVMRARRRARSELKALRRRLTHKDRFTKKSERLVGTISCPNVGQACPTYGAFARAALAQMAEEFFEVANARGSDDKTLHALRIAAKRWRYALELAAGVLRSPWTRELYNALNELQNRLGDVLDHAAVESRIAAWRSAAKSERRQEKLDEMAARHRRKVSSLRNEFRRWWTAARQRQLFEQWQQAAA